MSKIKIMCDSAGDLRYQAIEKYGIKVLPINIMFGEELVLDYYDIKYQEFYKKLKEMSELPTTSQISPTTFYDAYKEAAEEGYDTVLCFTISKAGSGTYNNANLACKMLEEDGIKLDVEVIDTMSYSLMYGRVAEVAAEMAQSGADKSQILDKIYPMLQRQVALFAVDNLKYLKAGGRIKPSVATIADILDIKPILSIEDGLVESKEKVRGKKKVIPKLLQLAKEEGIENASEIWIVHADIPEKAEEFKNAMEENLGITVTGISYIGPTIGINTGDGAFAVIFYKK
ncbi:MAG: DegV family protein [Clostridia bacterium]|nr:DegV family protein [Clostridia bacterium]